MDPSGDEAIAGQSSCRNWWPTGVELICAQRGKFFDFAVGDPSALFDHLEPVHLTDCMCCFDDCGLHGFGETDRRGENN